MKLRCYLRGLGIGIIVTALLMGLSTKPAKLSDAEVIAKAKQLGMIDGSTTLAEEAENQLEELEQKKETEASAEEVSEDVIQENVEESPEENVNQEAENTTEKVEEENNKSVLDEKLEEDLLGIRETGDEEEIPIEEEIDEEDTRPEEESSGENQSEESEQTEAGTAYTLEIRGGDTSVSVSRKLVELGLVADASEYDLFLCQNGYDKKICTGTYEINSGATYDDIAKIITKQN